MTSNSESASVTESLISRLQNAEEGSRELSDRVVEALGYSMTTSHDGFYTVYEVVCPDGQRFRGGVNGEYPDLTRSLDDALSMVPGHYRWSITEMVKGEEFEASLIKPGGGFLSGEGDDEVYAQAQTPAQALCIALLRRAE